MSDSALQMTVEVPVLAEICSRLGHIETRIAQLEAGSVLSQEWYTLRQAARLKRGIELRRHRKTGEIQPFDSYFNTLKTKYHLQPREGIPDGHQGGIAVWHRISIQEWLQRNLRPITMICFLILVILDSFGWLPNKLAPEEAWTLLSIGLEDMSSGGQRRRS